MLSATLAIIGVQGGYAAQAAATPGTTVQATATLGPGATATVVASPTATAAPSPAATATIAPSATPAPTPTATPLPVALPSIYYAISGTVYAMDIGGSPVAVAALPRGAALQPQLLPDGRLLYPTASGVAVVDKYGHRYALRMPDLNPGESVWSVAASPDASTLAWQLVAPGQVGGAVVNTGNVRIVLTGRFGDAGRTVFSAQASAPDGQAPVLLGWRPSSPYGLGGATLLLQDLYSQNDASARITLNTRRGLLEYDPQIDDVVNDYLPPLSSDIPAERAFGVSSDGIWAIYGDSNVLTPSGDGPLAQRIDALNLNTNALVRLDAASGYPSKTQIVTITKRTSGKRTITKKTATTLPLYQYFSHHAYVAPGDGRVLYNLLTVSYPPGALLPKVQQTALTATMDGRTHSVVAKDALAEGWLDSHTAVVATATGLQAVDLTSGSTITLARGKSITYLGVR